MSHKNTHDIRPLIQKKKRGLPLSSRDLAQWVQGIAADYFPDYQNAALLMAIVLKGMSLEETIQLTREMVHDERVIPKPKGVKRIGKHSTGGVGDKLTFLLGPLVASYGIQVPFMSGRGLGHTGGTIDKLSGIEGLQTRLSPKKVERVLDQAGFCIFEQSKDFAPVDSRLYALRDASGTVDSIPLIVSSILSKKAQEGLHGLLLDVKFGSGAFMPNLAGAKDLGKQLIQVARALKIKTTAVLTAMDQPLGQAIGNNLEIRECLDLMTGQGPEDLIQLTTRLGREMLALALPQSRLPSLGELRKRLRSGEMIEIFTRGLQAQGAKPGAWDRMKVARASMELQAPKQGWIRGLHARPLGEAAMLLGAGRKRLGAKIDPKVGLVLLKKLGDPVKAGEPWIRIHAPKARCSDGVLALMGSALEVGRAHRKVPPRVGGKIRS